MGSLPIVLSIALIPLIPGPAQGQTAANSSDSEAARVEEMVRKNVHVVDVLLPQQPHAMTKPGHKEMAG
jgi:hypothetical protein